MKFASTVYMRHGDVYRHNAIPAYPFAARGRFAFARRPTLDLPPMRQELWWFRGGKA